MFYSKYAKSAGWADQGGWRSTRSDLSIGYRWWGLVLSYDVGEQLGVKTTVSLEENLNNDSVISAEADLTSFVK